MLGKRLSIVVVVLVILGFAGTLFAASPYITGVRFDGFCRAYFGALKEPEMHRALGRDVTVPGDSVWTYASRNTAVVAWESSLPAKTYVQYGPKPGYYIYQTPITNRNHFLHVHYLKHLQPNTTYHYRLVTMDEMIRIVRSENMTFTTQRMAGAVEIPAGLAGPPYVLDKPDTTYLVTKDIKADSTAFNIAADGITLDLGGYTVTYNEKEGAPDPGASERLYGAFSTKGPCGVRTADGKKNIRIVNGTIRQGKANSASRPSGYYPVYMRRPRDTELAGTTIVYSGSQVSGVIVSNAYDGTTVHHNIIHDKGTELYNRHRGVEAILFDVGRTTKISKCHHNLIKRTRHVGIKASERNEIFSNEIYIDSYATNSYGVMYYSQRGAQNLSVHGNRIFGTGFHPIGIGSGLGWSDVRVYGNYVEMRGTSQDWRWGSGEGGGDKDAADKTGIYPVNGIRLQKPRSNVRHYDNTVVVKGHGRSCVMRGLWLVPDNRTGQNVTFRRNRVKVIALTPGATGHAIAACGLGLQTGKPRIVLRENVIESNLANVQFGDNYGAGGPYLFVGNTFVKSGHDSRYRTIRVGWKGSARETYGHRFEDNKFQGGAGFDKVSFDGAPGKKYDFWVAWNLDILTSPGAKVTIVNKAGQRIYTGTADAKGLAGVSLTEYVQSAAGKKVLTPHTIEVRKGAAKTTRKLTIDRSQTIGIKP